jgi:hypothetical protein
MFDFLFKQYEIGRLSFEKFKSLLVKYNLTNNVNIVETQEGLKFTANNYILKESEKFLDEAVFWTDSVL